MFLAGIQCLSFDQKTLDACLRTLLSGIKFSKGNKSVAEAGQHKALPLLARVSACNVITSDRPEPFGASQDRLVEGLCGTTNHEQEVVSPARVEISQDLM